MSIIDRCPVCDSPSPLGICCSEDCQEEADAQYDGLTYARILEQETPGDLRDHEWAVQTAHERDTQCDELPLDGPTLPEPEVGAGCYDLLEDIPY